MHAHSFTRTAAPLRALLRCASLPTGTAKMLLVPEGFSLNSMPDAARPLDYEVVVYCDEILSEALAQLVRPAGTSTTLCSQGFPCGTGATSLRNSL